METMRSFTSLAASSLALLALIVVLDIALFQLMPGDAIEDADLEITRWVVDARTPGLNSFMREATTLGSARLMWPVAAVAAGVAYLSARARLLSLLPLVAMLGGSIMNNLGKALTDRPRPLIRPLVDPGGSSFPSGHATIAAVIFSALAILIARACRDREGLRCGSPPARRSRSSPSRACTSAFTGLPTSSWGQPLESRGRCGAGERSPRPPLRRRSRRNRRRGLIVILRREGGVAEWFRQGPAKPCTAVRFRSPPPARMLVRGLADAEGAERSPASPSVLYRGCF